MLLPWVARAVHLRTCAGEREDGKTGVWVGGSKVAAVGIGASQWVTMHGFALNVCNDLAGFARIVPCGIEGHSVCSLAQLARGATMPAAQAAVEAAFEEVFGVRLVRGGALPGGVGREGLSAAPPRAALPPLQHANTWLSTPGARSERRGGWPGDWGARLLRRPLSRARELDPRRRRRPWRKVEAHTARTAAHRCPPAGSRNQAAAHRWASDGLGSGHGPAWC